MNKNRFLILLAACATLPGLYARLTDMSLSPLAVTGVAGLAIMSAAFLLLWACDAAQADISQALALAAVALISVLPEYAVDMYFTWQAGKFPASDYASYSVANMTGANRLVIGVAWALIAFIIWVKQRKPIILEEERRTEIVFLSLATLYAFVIPLKGTLAWYDMLVFVGLYVWYLYLSSQRPVQEIECDGPADELVRLPKALRRTATICLFLFAGCAILANAKPFCEGLVASGRVLGVNEFVLVQWLGPIASEAPEFIVAIMFALRGNGCVALGSLLSAKLNQWTLLVGMIPGVYALSHGSLDHPIPMGSFQINEIFLTAAQSLLAVFMIANLRFSIRYAAILFALFSGQIIAPILVEMLPEHSWLGLHGPQMHNVFSLLYFFGALILFIEHPNRLATLAKLNLTFAKSCGHAHERQCHDYPHCSRCRRPENQNQPERPTVVAK